MPEAMAQAEVADVGASVQRALRAAAAEARAEARQDRAQSPRASTWKCTVCTYLNDEGGQYCGACGSHHARPPPPRQQPQTELGGACWSCPRCTYTNSARMPRCEICLEDSPLLPAAPEHDDEEDLEEEEDEEEAPPRLADRPEWLQLEAAEGVSPLGWLPSSMPPEARVYVREVLHDSWAEEQGLRIGDELREAHGLQVPLLSREEFIDVMQRRPLRLTFRRAHEDFALEGDSQSEAALGEVEDDDEEEEDEDEDDDEEDDDDEEELEEDDDDDEVEEDLDEEGEEYDDEDLLQGPIALDFVDVEDEDGPASFSFYQDEVDDGETDPESELDSEIGLPLALGALPTHQISEQDVREAPPDRQECPICLEEYCAGATVLTLPCFHRFHEACAVQWLRRSLCCPTCKYSLASSGLWTSEG